jgi:hypothetical protein
LFVGASSTDQFTDADVMPGDLTTGIRWTSGDSQIKLTSMSKFRMHLRHPCAESLMSLLRVMAIDQMAASKDKGLSVVNILLDSAPLGRRSDIQQFHLEVFKSILNFVSSTKIFGDPKTSSKLVTNLGKFAAFIAERVTQDDWSNDHDTVQGFMIKLIRQVVDDHGVVNSIAESTFGSSTLRSTLDQLYRATSRLFLLRLVRADVNADMLAMVLSTLIEDQAVLLSDLNKDGDFIPCVLHKSFILIDAPETYNRDVGFQVLRLLFSRKMKDLFAVCVTPVQIPANMAVLPVPAFTAKVREYKLAVDDTVTKAWQSFLANRQRVIQSAQARLARRSAYLVKRDKQLKYRVAVFTEMHSHVHKATQAAHAHQKRASSRKQMKLLETRRVVKVEWANAMESLHRERGLWGPSAPSSLNKWMLADIEGPARVRKRLQANKLFYQHYAYIPEVDTGSVDEPAVKVVL